jgi:hypothetical protein
VTASAYGIVGGELLGTAHIEFKKSRHHDDGLRATAIFEHGEAERFSTAYEETATQAGLVAHDPASTPVLSDEKQWRSQGRLRTFRTRY